MTAQQQSTNKKSKSRDVDTSLYLFCAAIAGLVLFLVFLVGGETTSGNHTVEKQAYDGIEIVPRTPELGYQGK